MNSIVLDTNVLVAGVRSRNGASYELLSRIGGAEFRVCVSVPLVLEYESILLRQIDELALSAGDIEGLVNYVVTVAHHQEVFFLWRPQLRDPKDDMVLELAVAAQCNWIVTHNVRDFAATSQFGIGVATPQQYLRTLRDQS